MQIHVNKDGQQYGPFTLEQLQQYVQQGHFTAQDHAFYEGCQEWVTIAQVPGFAAEGQAATGQTQAQQDPAQQATQGQQQAQAAQQAQATQQSQAAPAQAQAQQAQAAQGQAAQQQVTAAVAVDVASKKKKIILWSSIGGVAALLVAGLLIWSPWSDDEEEKDEEKLAEKTTGKEDPTPKDDGKKENLAKVSSTPLLERIPAEALGVATLDLSKILEKGGTKVASMIPAEAPPVVRKILKDPSSIGLDVSEPVRLFFLRHPTKPDDDPTYGIIGKLGDAAKFKQTFEEMANPESAEEKDGYDLYMVSDDGSRSSSFLAVSTEFFLLFGNDDHRAGPEYLSKEIERFMTSDGSNSFVEAHPGLAKQASKGYDLGIWVDLEKVGALAEGEAPDELLGLVEAGTLSGGLRFDDGEVVLELDGASKGLGKALGGGGISSDLAKYLSADAALLASVSMNVDGLVGLFKDTLANEADLDLDEPIEQFGIAPREVLEVFQGDFAFSLTKLPPMGGGSSVPDMEEATESPREFRDDPGNFRDDPGNFGDEGDKGNAGPPPNPFADTPKRPEIAVDPVPQIAIDPPPFGGGPPPGGFDGGPPGGPPPGGPPPGMASSMPEFALAASIDNAKWNALMQKSPPLAGLLAMAQVMGLSVKAENGVFTVASANHASAVAQGSMPNPVDSIAKKLFTSHDFALKINSKVLVKALMDEGMMPPPLGQALGGLDSLAVTADSRAGGGSLSVRLSFTDKQANSLSALIDLGMILESALSYDEPVGESDFIAE